MKCTEHLSCRIPVGVSSGDVVMVAGDNGWYHFEYVTVNGDTLGTVSDRSVVCFDGHVLAKWTAFGGGNHLGDCNSRDEAVRLVVRNAVESAFAWRMALHG